MSEQENGLKKVMDITISDRLSSQIKSETVIAELKARVKLLESELVKSKTTISVNVDGKNGQHDIRLELNGQATTVPIPDQILDFYLTNSDPLGSLLSDAVKLLVEPYSRVLKEEIKKDVNSLLENRKQIRKGTSL